MKHTVSYSDLLLNTMLDTMKREDRRTIDGTDIINFEKVVNSIVKTYCFPIEFESIKNGRNFLEEIEPYIFMVEENNTETYTLLPWITEEELEDRVKNTIFVDMSFVYQATTEALRFKRDRRSVYKLRDIEREVNTNFLKSIQNNVVQLENEKQKEMIKLQRIKQNLGMSE